MDNMTPSSEFEKKVAAAAAAPNASPEFVSTLRAEVLRAGRAAATQAAPSLWQRLRQGLTLSQGRGRWLASALGAAVVVGVVVFASLNLTMPVSAQQILERATAAQSAAALSQGIRHVRIELYQNLTGQGGPQAGSTTLIESYENASTGSASSQALTGYFRSITTDAAGKIVDAGAFDGSFYYSTYPTYSTTPAGDGETLTIYRTPLDEDDRQKAMAQTDATAANERAIFDQFRNNPRVELVGKETRPDGSQVYRLIDRNYQVETQPNGQEAKTFTGSMTMLFDAQTYRLLETIRMVRKDGEDIVLENVRFLTDEVLAAESPVAWDLSDLKGAKIVDETPQTAPAEHEPFRPISEHELAAHINGYVLSPLPEGFTQNIVFSPKLPEDEHDSFEINYQKDGKDVFGMMYVGVMDEGFVETSFYDGSYKTATGLVIYFSTGSGSGTSGMLTVPDGTSFLLFSSLGREEVQRLAETLVPAQ